MANRIAGWGGALRTSWAGREGGRWPKDLEGWEAAPLIFAGSALRHGRARAACVGVPPAKALAAPSCSGFACSGPSVTLVGVTLGPHPWLLAEDRGYVDGWQRPGHARKRQPG